MEEPVWDTMGSHSMGEAPIASATHENPGYTMAAVIQKKPLLKGVNSRY